MYKTILAIGVIALFIGVGIQPAISNEVTIPQTFDSERDCIECQSNGKTHLAEKIIYKVENYLESKDLIKSDNLPFERPVCKMLESIIFKYHDLYLFFTDLYNNETFDTPEWWFYYNLAQIYGLLMIYLSIAGRAFFCWDDPPIPY